MSNDPFLRRPFFVADADPKAGATALLCELSGPTTRWLGAAVRGTSIELPGLPGRPLPSAGGQQQLLLHRAAARDRELPPCLRPPEVEYLAGAAWQEALLSHPLSNSSLTPAPVKR